MMRSLVLTKPRIHLHSTAEATAVSDKDVNIVSLSMASGRTGTRILDWCITHAYWSLYFPRFILHFFPIQDRYCSKKQLSPIATCGSAGTYPQLSHPSCSYTEQSRCSRSSSSQQSVAAGGEVMNTCSTALVSAVGARMNWSPLDPTRSPVFSFFSGRCSISVTTPI